LCFFDQDGPDTKDSPIKKKKTISDFFEPKAKRTKLDKAEESKS